ncbi:helix-turn-helix domain-containing protein [Actinomadura miaoliensis]|uniref:Transposase IS30-like HTH domain-containing protein n=1 Tax=Actinomadura miaoliensis TaxID=430685 RepID=A0ABP7V5L9_9ACTN
MAARRPITDDDRRRVAELHAQGLSRNAIAKEIKRSQATVSKLAAELGLSFRRERTAEATRAKVLDAKARRAALALDLLGDAERLRRQLWEPCTLVKIGGKDNVATEHPLPRPLFDDQLRIVQATGLAVERHARLVELDADTGHDNARSLLGALLGGLQAKHGTDPE